MTNTSREIPLYRELLRTFTKDRGGEIYGGPQDQKVSYPGKYCERKTRTGEHTTMW